MEEIELHLDKICRACKNEEEKMYSVFETDIVLDQRTMLAEIFKACTSIQITEYDEMPKLICESCIEQLNIAFSFKKLCENTDFYLRSYIEKHKIRNETSNKIVEDCSGTSKLQIKSSELEVTGVYACKYCNKYFINLKSLELHNNNYHKNVLIETNNCFGEISKNGYLKQDDQTCELDALFMCKICKKYVTNEQRRDHLEAHKISGDNVKTCVCLICNINFYDEVKLKAHMVTDHGINENSAMLDSTANFADYYIEIINNEVDSSIVNTIKLEDAVDDGCSETNSDENKKTLVKYENDIKVEDSENNSEINDAESQSATSPDDNVVTKEPKRRRGRPRKNEERLYIKQNESKEIINYPCIYCDKILKTKLGYDVHIKKHSGKEVIECIKCYQQFSTTNELTSHIQENHKNQITDIKNIKCAICDTNLENIEKYVKHKYQEHNVRLKLLNSLQLSCRCCKQTFVDKFSRSLHEKTHTIEKKCTCKTCGKRFFTKKNLAEHVRLHTECAKKFLCSECGKRFIRYDYLVIHMRRHRGEKPFKCKYCGKGFPRTTDLTVHERYHTGEKTHLCVICGRGFGRSYNLTVHMRTHTGEKPYQCTYCEAAFAQGNDLKAHVRRHTGERYHCEICSEGFLMGYLLTQHKRMVHGLDVKSHIRRLKPSERVNLTQSKDQQSYSTMSNSILIDDELQMQMFKTTDILNIKADLTELSSDNLQPTIDSIDAIT